MMIRSYHWYQHVYVRLHELLGACYRRLCTIMVALGDNEMVEIMFADNGEGIMTNLKNAGYSGKNL